MSSLSLYYASLTEIWTFELKFKLWKSDHFRRSDPTNQGQKTQINHLWRTGHRLGRVYLCRSSECRAAESQPSSREWPQVILRRRLRLRLEFLSSFCRSFVCIRSISWSMSASDLCFDPPSKGAFIAQSGKGRSLITKLIFSHYTICFYNHGPSKSWL